MKVMVRQGYEEIKMEMTQKRLDLILEALTPFVTDSGYYIIVSEKKKETPEAEGEKTATEENSQVNNITFAPDPQREAVQEPKKKDLNRLRELLNTAKTKKEIAAEFGVSVSSIYNWIEELHELDAVFDKAEVSKK